MAKKQKVAKKRPPRRDANQTAFDEMQRIIDKTEVGPRKATRKKK